MSAEHQGCRVCGRTDVTLKQDGTLRMHAHTKGGNAWLAPGGNRCNGAGYPPKGTLGRYALRVIEILRPHFPDLDKPHIAKVIGEAIQQYHTSPQPSFEALLDERGNWRLKPVSMHPGRVRVACYRLNERADDVELESQLNASIDSFPYH